MVSWKPARPCRDLVGILIRFRRFHIGLQADIEKMFMQIVLHEADRDVVRFLWRDLNYELEPTIFRFRRVCFGLNCSPFLALAVLRHHAQVIGKKFPRAAAEILENMYVDDLVTSCDRVEDAVAVVQDTMQLMNRGGFTLTRWANNCPSLNDFVDKSSSGSGAGRTLRTLGLSWDRIDDTLAINVPRLSSRPTDTKRQMLKALASVFDPLGWVAHFVK
uniref:Reverse transcriptase domain-containing protein n=1 Tax=Trichuris muris TaxID=70415 RepID=A0A5S6R5K8_TRIMR